MPKLVLCRHGETIFNAQKRYQGKVDIPLDENGLSAGRSSAATARPGQTGCRLFVATSSGPSRRPRSSSAAILPA